MTPIQRHTLDNGLRVIVHEDHTTPLAAFNVAYDVGSRDEHPDCTGLAHLMEHFMFTGSVNVPEFDKALQQVGAVNNAYTSQDLTNYYILLPANNLETAFWVDSDRMLKLACRQESLDIQKQVVIEEFKESYLNHPYGDVLILFNPMVYKTHPYQWLPIGKSIETIAEVDMDTVCEFQHRFYHPGNAVLVVAGDVHADQVFALAEKWFGDIPAGPAKGKNYPQEQPQTEARRLTVHRDVPSDLLFKGWRMCDRLHPDFYAFDLLSDLLGTGQSSYLYKTLVTEKHLFTDISAAVTGTADEGVFQINGRPAEGVTIEAADEALSDYLYHFQYDGQLSHDLQKVQNAAESILLYNNIKIDDRATNLAVWETLDHVERFLDERQRYFDVTEDQICRLTRELFTEEKSCTLLYKAL
jgi:Predicted Zn-dependent peptidases